MKNPIPPHRQHECNKRKTRQHPENMRNLVPMRQLHLRLNEPTPLLHLLPAPAVHRCQLVRTRRRLALGVVALVGGEAAVLDIVLDEVFFFLPAGAQPAVEGFRGGEGDGGDGEAAPEHVDGFGGAALEVGGAEGEDVLAVGAAAEEGGINTNKRIKKIIFFEDLRYSLVGNGAVVDPVNGSCELLQTVLESCTARK